MAGAQLLGVQILAPRQPRKLGRLGKLGKFKEFPKKSPDLGSSQVRRILEKVQNTVVSLTCLTQGRADWVLMYLESRGWEAD